MTTIEARVTVNMPWHNYGITSRTITVTVYNGEDIMDILIQQLKGIQGHEKYYERVEKKNITFDSLIIV